MLAGPAIALWLADDNTAILLRDATCHIKPPATSKHVNHTSAMSGCHSLHVNGHESLSMYLSNVYQPRLVLLKACRNSPGATAAEEGV